MSWTTNYSLERLKMEKSFCEIKLRNPDIYKHTIVCGPHMVDVQIFMGSMEGKIRMLDKEIKDRIIEEILLGDNNALPHL